MARNRRNQQMVYCKHTETIIDRGTCDECNEAKRSKQAPGVRVRLKPGYHYGVGQMIGSERELYRVAAEQNATVRWD